MKHLFTAATKRVQASLDDDILEFFKQNPDPSDPDVHEFAGKLGIEPEILEKHIYRLFTEATDKKLGARMTAGVRSRVTKNGRLQLAYMFSVPVGKAPPAEMTDLMRKAAYTGLFEAFYVVSDRLALGNHVFEAHARDRERVYEYVRNYLPRLGWTVKPGKTEDAMLCRKGPLSFHLIFVTTGS